MIATGVQYSVREFIEWTAAALGMAIRWEGSGVDEVGYAVIVSEEQQSISPDVPVVRIDPRYFRPTEVENAPGRSY